MRQEPPSDSRNRCQFQHHGLRRRFRQFVIRATIWGCESRLTGLSASDISGLMFKRFINKFLARHYGLSAVSTCSSLIPCAQLFKKRACVHLPCVPLPLSSSLKPHRALCAIKSTCNGVTGSLHPPPRKSVSGGIVFITRRAIRICYRVGSSCGINFIRWMAATQRVTRMPLICANGRSGTFTLRIRPVPQRLPA